MIPKIKIFQNKYENPKFSFVAIIVLTGSIFEKKNEKGISHFIEHLIFKGSKFNENLKNLNNKLNSLGMSVNAFTTQFMTVFHINTPTKYINNAIDSLIQIVFNPLFNQDDIEKEREVVINELTQKYNNPENAVQIYAQSIINGKNNPLKDPVIGFVKTLKNITQQDILNYYNKYYQGINMVFFTLTSKNSKTIEKIWKTSFNKYGNVPLEPYPSTLELFQKIKPKLELIGKPGKYQISDKFPKNETILVMLYYILPKCSAKEKAALDIFDNYLTGSLSSKLFIELREKKQLIYSISSDAFSKIDSTGFTIEFNTKKDKKVLAECLKTINSILRDFFKNGIPINEFKKFKNKTLILYEKLKNKELIILNGLIDKEFFGIDMKNYENTLKKTTNNDVNKFVTKLFKNRKTKKFLFIV